MAIVSCPDCGKKLKIADASVGKKVKGPCGHVFVAQAGEEPAPPKPAPAAAAPEKVYVACTECGSKLKVATTSLGKKMKCPKCAAVFVASLPDEEPAPAPKPKAKPAVSDDDMDDLLSFAQADASNGQSQPEDDDLFKDEPVKSRAQRKMDEEAEADEEPRPKGKARPKTMDDDDDEAPMPKGKKPGKPSRFGKDDKPAAPVYPSRLIPTLLATLLLLVFGGLVGAIFFGVNIAKEIGLPEPKAVRRPIPNKLDAGGDKDQIAKGKDKDKIDDKDAANKKEAAKLDGVWIVVSAEMPGMSLDAMKGLKFVFADGVVTTPDPLVAPFTVDASQNPKWINLPTAANVPVPGIYELDGDTLKWCTSLPQKKKLPGGKEVMAAGPRPKKLDAAEGVLVVLTREKSAVTDPPEPKKDKDDIKDKNAKDKDTNDKEQTEAKIKAAKAQIDVLTQASQAFRVKNIEYPASLQELVDAKPAFLKSNDALLDPWKQPFQYDPAGQKNNGAKPDIWTVTPDKLTIGNWMRNKQEDKEIKDKEIKDKKEKKDDPEPDERSEEVLLRRKAEEAILTDFLTTRPKEEDLPEGVDAHAVVAALGPAGLKIGAAAFSPKSALLAVAGSGDEDSGVLLVNLKDRSTKKLATKIFVFQSRLAFSPSGDLIALASGDRFGDKFVKVWRVADATEIQSFPLEFEPDRLEFSSNGALLTCLANGINETEAKIWKVVDWKVSPLCAKLNKNARYLLSDDGDELLQKAENAKEVLRYRLQTGESQIEGTARGDRFPFFLTKKWIAYRVSQEAGGGDALEVIDRKSAGVKALPHGPGTILTARITPDGRYAYCQMFSGGMRVTEIASGKSVANPGSILDTLTFSPGGLFVARSNPNVDKIHLLARAEWLTEPPPVKRDYVKEDLKTRDEAVSLALAQRRKLEEGWLDAWSKNPPKTAPGVAAELPINGEAVVAMAFAPAMPVAALVVRDKEGKSSVQIWDLATLKPGKAIALDMPGNTPRLVFSPDSSLLAVEGPVVRIWKVADGSEVKAITPKARFHGKVGFSADNKFLIATTSSLNDVYLWDTSTWQSTKFNARTDRDITFVLDPAGEKIFEMGREQSMRAHDLKSGQIKEVPLPDMPGPFDLYASPRGRYAAYSQFVNAKLYKVQIVDVRAGVTKTIAQETNVARDFQFSPDGGRLIYTSGDSYKAIDLDGKTPAKNLGPISQALTVSPGGIFVARNVSEPAPSLQLIRFGDLPNKKKPGDDLEKTVKKLGGRLIRDDKMPGIEVDLTASKIVDADLKLLAGLKELRKLRVGSTKITGVGLKYLNDLENLEELDLSFTLVDDDAAKELAAFKKLKVLSVLNCKLTDDGLKVIAELENLQQLTASQNKLTDAGVKTLANLKELRRLELGNTGAGNDALKAIGQLDKLDKLVLHGTLITDAGMKDVAKLKNLQELRLSFNISDTGMKDLAELTELRVLVLNSSRVKDDGMKVVGGFTNLKELEMQFTKVSDAGMKEIAGLKHLEILNLTGTNVMDPGLKTLAELTSLKRLILRNTKVSAEAVAELKQSLPKCQVFHK